MSKTFCDFYAFRTRSDHTTVISCLRLALGGSGGKLGHTIQSGGWHGYANHSLLNYAGVQVGVVAWGGDNQAGWVHASLSGKGCEFVESWVFFEAIVQDLPEFSYRRVDLALDVRDGSCTHDRAVEAYRWGQFDQRGQRPKAERIEPEDRRNGCTFYVGNRKSWRFFRGYDKGRELRAKWGRPNLTHIDGVPVEDLYRLEVEFKAVDGVRLPIDLVSDRDRYFAGAYPFLASLLAEVEPRPFRVPRKHVVQSDLLRALASCQRMFGGAIAAALKAYGGNRDAVLDQIVGDRISDRWVAAGALIEIDKP